MTMSKEDLQRIADDIDQEVAEALQKASAKAGEIKNEIEDDVESWWSETPVAKRNARVVIVGLVVALVLVGIGTWLST